MSNEEEQSVLVDESAKPELKIDLVKDLEADNAGSYHLNFLLFIEIFLFMINFLFQNNQLNLHLNLLLYQQK